MSQFLQSCVDKYLDLAKLPASSLKAVDTPYLDESKFPGIGDVVKKPLLMVLLNQLRAAS